MIFFIRYDLNMIKELVGCQKCLPNCLGQLNFEKKCPNKSENILEYHQKSAIVFICIFVLRNDLNMIKISGWLSKMFALLSGTTKSLEKMAKRKVKIF